MPPKAAKAAAHEEASGVSTGMLSVSNTTTRFDAKLVNRLAYPVPALRATMVDHTLERLPMEEAVKGQGSMISLKPSHQLPFPGDPGGAFYAPTRAMITQPPTGFDNNAELNPTVNGVEQHFERYFRSGEVTRLPAWTRSHWTGDTEGPVPKVDRRRAAFKEVCGGRRNPATRLNVGAWSAAPAL